MQQSEKVSTGGFNIIKHALRENGEALYGCKYSPDGKFFAATLGSGALRVFDGQDFKLLQRSKLGAGFDEVPSCCVRFRPECEFTEEGIQELVTTSSAGGIFGFSLDSSDGEDLFLDRTWKMVEDNNDTICCDYSPDGTLIATVGADRNVRVYDANTRKLKDTLTKGHDDQGHTRPAHTNRIFCAKYANPTTLITGGWENPVQIWDMRTGKSERQLGGPHVSSDSIDLLPGGQQIVVGSARPERQIQVFDFLSCREIVQDSERISKPLDRAAITCLKYCSASNSVWAATSKPESIFCIDFESGQLKGKVDTPHVVFGLDPCPKSKNRAVAVGAKEFLWTLDVQA